MPGLGAPPWRRLGVAKSLSALLSTQYAQVFTQCAQSPNSQNKLRSAAHQLLSSSTVPGSIPWFYPPRFRGWAEEGEPDVKGGHTGLGLPPCRRLGVLQGPSTPCFKRSRRLSVLQNSPASLKALSCAPLIYLEHPTPKSVQTPGAFFLTLGLLGFEWPVFSVPPPGITATAHKSILPPFYFT